MAELKFDIPERWWKLRLAVTSTNPDAGTLEEFLFDNYFSSLVANFEKQRQNTITSLTDWVDRTDWDQSTTQPGMSYELRPLYNYFTFGIPRGLESTLRIIIHNELAAATRGGEIVVSEDEFMSKLFVAAENAERDSRARLETTISRFVSIQESYWRPFFKKYGLMVAALGVFRVITTKIIFEWVKSEMRGVVAQAQGTGWAPMFKAAFSVYRGMHWLSRPILLIKEIAKYLWSNKLAFWASFAETWRYVRAAAGSAFMDYGGPVGIIPAFGALSMLTGIASGAFVAGMIIGYVGWEFLEWLGVKMPNVSEGKLAEIKAQFDPQEWGLIQEQSSEVGSVLANLLKELDFFKKEQAGEIEQPLAVRPLSERLQAFKQRIGASVNQSSLPEGFSVEFILAPLLSRVDEMIVEANRKEQSTLGAATGGVDIEVLPEHLYYDESTIWEFIQPDVVEAVTDGMSDEEIAAVLEGIVRREEAGIREVIRRGFLAQVQSAVISREGMAPERAAKAAEMLRDLADAPSLNRAMYEIAIGMLEEALTEFPEGNWVSGDNATVDREDILLLISFGREAVQEINLLEARQRKIDAGGKPEDTLTARAEE